METSGPTSGISQLLNTLTTRATTLQLQVGQQLQATVLDNSAGRILLSLGHRQVSAQSSLPFERGQALTVEVRSLGAQPVLRIISALQESPVAMAVRLLLPRHAASTPLLANLGVLARNPTTPVPPLIREVARTLVDSLPTINSLNTAAGVKTAIQQSGLLLEHKLLQAATTPNAAPIPVGADYKANLVRLIQLVRNWPGSGPAAPRSSAPAVAGQLPVGAPLTQPGAVNTPATPQPLAGTTTTTPNPAASNAAAGETGKPAATDAVKQAPAAATPDQMQRAIQMTQTPARSGAPPTARYVTRINHCAARVCGCHPGRPQSASTVPWRYSGTTSFRAGNT